MPLLFSFTMCGSRGSPEPPYSKVPAVPKLGGVQQQFKSVVVYWNKVSTFSDGRKLSIPDSVVYVVSVDFGRRVFKTKKNYLIERIKEFKGKRCYAVAAEYGGRRGEFSDPICIELKSPVKKLPEVKKVTSGDGFVVFEFYSHELPIEVFKNGKTPYVKPYRVVNPGSTVFKDNQVEDGKTYAYRFRFARSIYKGPLTRTYKLVPLDKIPPLPPQNPLLIAANSTCTLIWEPSPSKDVVAYKIVADGKVFVLPKTSIYFQLQNCPNSVKLIAVDKGKNESKAVIPKEVLR